MTISPLLALGGIVVILGLALAYIGAATRAAVLQVTVQAMLPLYEAMTRALDAEVQKAADGKG